MRFATILTAFISISTLSQAAPLDSLELSKRESSGGFEISQFDHAASLTNAFAKRGDDPISGLLETVAKADPVAKGLLNIFNPAEVFSKLIELFNTSIGDFAEVLKGSGFLSNFVSAFLENTKPLEFIEKVVSELVSGDALNLDELVADLAGFNAPEKYKAAGGEASAPAGEAKAASDAGASSEKSSGASNGLAGIFKGISEGFKSIFGPKSNSKRDDVSVTKRCIGCTVGLLTSLVSIFCNKKVIESCFSFIQASIPIQKVIIQTSIKYLIKVGVQISASIKVIIEKLISSGIITEVINMIFANKSLLANLNFSLQCMVGEDATLPNIGKIVGSLLGEGGIEWAIEKTC